MPVVHKMSFTRDKLLYQQYQHFKIAKHHTLLNHLTMFYREQQFISYEDSYQSQDTVKRWTFAQNQQFRYSSVLHSHTLLMKLCTCARYRQLNSRSYILIIIY